MPCPYHPPWQYYISASCCTLHDKWYKLRPKCKQYILYVFDLALCAIIRCILLRCRHTEPSLKFNI
jgi:hypothetical protein